MLLLVLLLLFWLQAPTIAKRLQTICVFRDYVGLDGSYYMPGDLIICGNLPLGIIVKSPAPDFNIMNLPLQKTRNVQIIVLFALKLGTFFRNTSSICTVLLGVGFEFSQGEKRVYPSFFWINPKESPQYAGLVQLLLYFQWNWVGLLAPEDERGEHFISTLTPMLQVKEICLAFTLMLKLDSFEIIQKTFILNFLTLSKTEVLILFADSVVTGCLIGGLYFFENIMKVSFRKVCIFTSHWKLGMGQSEDKLQYIKLLHGVLHLRDHSGMSLNSATSSCL
ncbi:hypothetical protein E2320_022825 [Naja naja]|nr:hypothetical protein E2320_022825 [Naja naja]